MNISSTFSKLMCSLITKTTQMRPNNQATVSLQHVLLRTVFFVFTLLRPLTVMMSNRTTRCHSSESTFLLRVTGIRRCHLRLAR